MSFAIFIYSYSFLQRFAEILQQIPSLPLKPEEDNNDDLVSGHFRELSHGLWVCVFMWKFVLEKYISVLQTDSPVGVAHGQMCHF